MNLLSLVGEQPIPILLPARWLQPRRNLLAHTSLSEKTARRLQAALGGDCRLRRLRSSPYDLSGLLGELEALLDDGDGGQWTINLTGATKTMALAACEAARRRQTPFVYLESEEGRSQLYHYRFDGGDAAPFDPSRQPVPLPELITLDDYLRAHVGEYAEEGFHRGQNGGLDDGGLFEQAAAQALREAGLEVKAGLRPAGVKDQLEIDLAFRLGNRAGIAELKLGGGENLKSGLDQLAMAGGREYLGAYTAKFWVIARALREKANNLRALAQERGIEIIELPGYRRGRSRLSEDERRRLVQKVKSGLVG